MADSDSPRETRLSRELHRETASRKVTPRDVFELALDKWLRGDRVEIGVLAEEIGVSRATVFRWVGSRELLLGEILWSLFSATWKYALAKAKGNGADYAAEVTGLLMTSVLDSDVFRRFLEQDPEGALRILTSKTSVVRTRIMAEVCELLRAQTRAGHIAPALEAEDLAYVLVRIFESCLYSDQIAGRTPNIELTCAAIRILVAAQQSPAPGVSSRAPAGKKKPSRRTVR